jgi:dihydrofolate reductase
VALPALKVDGHRQFVTEERNLMGTLMIDFIASLDGYGAAEGWPGWWGMESAEYLGWLDEQPDRVTLMGATTYRQMSDLATQGEEGVDRLTRLAKVVFSSTLTEPPAWANTRLVTSDAVEAVRAMKADTALEMSTLGSVSLCRSLLAAELVDRFRVIIFPVITGATGQDRIYDGYPDVRLDLVESRTFEGGLQLMEYLPTVLHGAPAR